MVQLRSTFLKVIETENDLKFGSFFDLVLVHNLNCYSNKNLASITKSLWLITGYFLTTFHTRSYFKIDFFSYYMLAYSDSTKKSFYHSYLIIIKATYCCHSCEVWYLNLNELCNPRNKLVINFLNLVVILNFILLKICSIYTANFKFGKVIRVVACS